ncbi:hypothetical protein IKF12_03110 [Candidatus Saccharibacteria bacterium]|nr:hypothetical protein [Candidatus Saccharibacteria bacterium]
MASDIKSIDDQVKVLVDNIKKLQDEIKTYQSGYKAFETASAALEALAKTQGGLSDSLASSLKTLEKIDAVTIMKRIDETTDKLSSTTLSIEKLVKEMNLKEEVAELKKQNDQIAKQLASLNSRLDEGVAVKKKKWFA